MPGFQSTQLATEGALEPFFFLYTDDSIQGNPETCKQSSIMLNYEVKNMLIPAGMPENRHMAIPNTASYIRTMLRKISLPCISSINLVTN